jgi:hypothetical protein
LISSINILRNTNTGPEKWQFREYEGVVCCLKKITQSGLFFFELRMGLELGGKGINAEDAEEGNSNGGRPREGAWSERRRKRLVTLSLTGKVRKCRFMGRHKVTKRGL